MMNNFKNKTLCLSASAGTGKTFALTVRYISLLLNGATPQEILTLTFTKKAALEMSNRIFKTLQSLGDDEAYMKAIEDASGLNANDIKNQKEKLISNFLQSELSIFTIDKFVNKILREFSGYANISDDFEIKNDDMSKLGFEFLNYLDEKDFEILLRFAHYENKQYQTLLTIFKDLSQKDEQIVKDHIENGLVEVAQKQVIKKALKIKEYVHNHEKSTKTAKNAVEFNSFDEIFKSTWIQKDNFADFRSFTKAIQSQQAEDLFQEFKQSCKEYFYIKSQYQLGQLDILLERFKEFKLDYQKGKNYLEFSDISNLTNKLLNKTISGQNDFLYFRLDTKYNHILIDEFQDTSLLQFNILKPMIDEVCSGLSSSFKTFFYVGDIKQSIYRFRGGNSILFEYVSKKYNIPVQSLKQNFRSRKNIVEFVNEKFVNYKNMPAQQSNNDGGYISINNMPKGFKDGNFEDILIYIKSLLSKGLDPKQIAILVYKNDDVLNIYNYLKQHLPNIDIVTDMTSRLIAVPNIKAIINYLKYHYFKEDKNSSIYLENFHALIGKNTQIKCEYNVDIKTNTLSDIVYLVASYYKLLDQNMIKFIEVLSSYSDIVDFIYHIDNDDTPMVNKDNIGLQILTVYKSKGLEFDTVLLVDRITKKSNDTSMLLFEYDDIKLQNIHIKMKYKEYFDDNYKNALENEKHLKSIDEKNTLYVAYTRAVDNLIIFSQDDEPCEIGALEIGENKNDISTIKAKHYEPLKLGYQNIKANKVDENNNIHAQYFGIATHHCLEMLNKFDSKSLEISLSHTQSRFSNFLDENDFDRILKICTYLIEYSEFKDLICNAKISKEQQLVFNGELKILDLLIQKDDQIIVCDYKTTVTQKEEHTLQVMSYKKALGDIFKDKKILGFIIYLKDDGVKMVEV